MHVVLSMTGLAGGGCVGRGSRGPMAGRALESGVGAVQWEIGLAVVIERPQHPAVGVVAGFASIAQRPLVLVIVAMTFHALARSVAVGGRQVAFLAWCGRVQSDQGKARETVIEQHPAAPGILVVAVGALGSLLSLVGIVGPVTGHAGGLQFLLQSAPVAGGAGDASMGALENEVGVAVVIEAHAKPTFLAVAVSAGLAVASLVAVVFGMAACARRLQRRVLERGGVAASAGDPGMHTAQGEIGFLAVVEA